MSELPEVFKYAAKQIETEEERFICIAISKSPFCSTIRGIASSIIQKRLGSYATVESYLFYNHFNEHEKDLLRCRDKGDTSTN